MKFVKQSHLPYNAYIALLTITVCICINPQMNSLFADLFYIVLVLFLALLFSRYVNSFGLYIEEKIYYKSFVEKEVCPERIAAIHVTKAVQKSKYFPTSEIKDENGNCEYTMFFLKEVTGPVLATKTSDLGDVEFYSLYKKYIICRCIYDQSVIDYLLTLNPNIIVF